MQPARSRFTAALLALLVAGCNRSAPPPPTTNPTPGERITGSERLGWDQRSASATELATFRYAIYVDGARSELTDTSCATSSQAAGFPCSARLPALTPGAHTLELASFVVDGGVLESARSAAFAVVVAPAATAARAGPAWPDRAIATADGFRLRAEVVASGLDDPTDLAAAPDGRLFIAERSGGIVVVDLPPVGSRFSAIAPRATAAGTIGLKPDPTVGGGVAAGDSPFDDIAIANGAGGLLALALDPQFARTHTVFAVYTGRAPGGGWVFRVARLREAHGTFADRVALLDGVPVSSRPAAALRFGPDGRLYLAFDDGGAETSREDLAASNGKVLRLNPDGSTPSEQASGVPLFSWPYAAPRALAWDRTGAALWVADARPDGPILTAVTVSDPVRVRGTTRARYRLPVSTAVTGMTFYRGDSPPGLHGDLFVATGTDRCLLRVRFDPAAPLHIVATERLLQDLVGPIGAVTAGADGILYFSTDDAVARLVPDP